MHIEIKRFDIASVVKIFFVIYAILGMVIGLVYVLVALVFSSVLDFAGAFEGTTLLRVAATGVGILLVPLFALLYGLVGALAGLVGSVVYNLVSKALGGVKLTLEADGVDGTNGPAAGLSNQAEMRL
jgi:uncharacterized membrane protein YagU involved in acid resistance